MRRGPLGHAAASRLVEAQKGAGRQAAGEEILAKVVAALLAVWAVRQTARFAGQAGFDQHALAGLEVAAGQSRRDLGHYLVPQDGRQRGIGLKQEGFRALEQVHVRTADPAEHGFELDPASGRIKGHFRKLKRRKKRKETAPAPARQKAA